MITLLASSSVLPLNELNKKLHKSLTFSVLRDRPFSLQGGGYGFLFRSEICFRTTQELEYLFFLSRKVPIFFPAFNIRLYDKNSELD